MTDVILIGIFLLLLADSPFIRFVVMHFIDSVREGQFKRRNNVSK